MQKCVEVRVICRQMRPWRPHLQKLLRKIRKIPCLTRVLKPKIALLGAFERFSKLYQRAYLAKCKTRFLVLWCSVTKTRVKQGYFRILSEMFCKSLPKSAVAAPRWRRIKLRTRHRAAHDIEPRVRQAARALSHSHNQIIPDARYIFYGTRQIALGQGDPLHEHSFFRTSFDHL